MASTFAELWSEIEGAALSAVTAIKDEVIAIEQQIEAEIEADVVLLLGQLKDLAIATVIEMAKLSISGEEKFGNVVTTVFQHAEANAIAIGIADAQMLAQQAFRAVQKAVSSL